MLPLVNLVPTLFTRGNLSQCKREGGGNGRGIRHRFVPNRLPRYGSGKKTLPFPGRPTNPPSSEVSGRGATEEANFRECHRHRFPHKRGRVPGKKIQVYLWGKGNVAQRLSEKSFCFPPSLFARTHAKGNFQIKGGRKHSSSLSPLRWGRREHFPPNVDSSKGEF